ncbi:MULTISPECIES: DNA sulfur modification protein DndD [unclassified Thioalkalivibrio]|uniref:DNA sulfur modification protein DndD n=1 Tax=unclassified Thioalkalivibrio TaxID=2621013 RepID=UPI000381EB0A|nr:MULTISPECIES: DNA sulfur modification protein DndD [unclassified Thioalkalivibrio]
MVIDELVLHNFGIFGGRQSIRLDPPSPDKPVILFGGLNGAGKTTLLEALQLALFGKLAPPARDSDGGYEEYLERSINRRVRLKDGASVEIAFRSTGDGEEKTYRVRRSWALRRTNIQETIDVEVDGSRDAALSDTWADQVHRFLPPQLAPLFLFDGERIESLADPETSEGFLSVAIESLLGMDLVRQLETDLSVLERRKRAESLSDQARARVTEENSTLENLDQDIRARKEEAGQLRNTLDGLERQRQSIERDYRAQGGELLQQREALETERQALKDSIASNRSALGELAAGALPLALASNHLRQTLRQADYEAEQKQSLADQRQLRQHREQLETCLLGAGASEAVLGALTEYFDSVAGQADSATQASLYLDLADGTRQAGHRVLQSVLDEDLGRAAGIVDELQRNVDRLDDVERHLAAVPEADAIRDVAARREHVLSEQRETQVRLDEILRQLSELEAKRVRQQELVDRLLKDAASEGLEEERRQRLLEHSSWARNTLGKFRQAALERNLERIQDYVFECYRLLLRKSSLVASVRIDPERYRMSLIDNMGNEISPKRLSAGERQLLAVATLWGLARASGRPLPVVVDTPLGRLDGTHREHLVERYFPEASHQVLLLSTDEEIVDRYLSALRPSVGRFYRLEYDDETCSTRVEEGYFGEVAA